MRIGETLSNNWNMEGRVVRPFGIRGVEHEWWIETFFLFPACVVVHGCCSLTAGQIR